VLTPLASPTIISLIEEEGGVKEKRKKKRKNRLARIVRKEKGRKKSKNIPFLCM